MSFLMSKQLNSLEDLLVLQMDDLYDAERQIIDALPKMEEAAKSTDLKKAFRQHLETSNRQLKRLEDCFRELDKQPGNETCNGMRGIIDEGEKIVSAEGDSDVRDAGLTASAQRVEHYEISGYGSARTFAQHLGHERIASVLQEILDEERETDRRLTELAERSVNVRAQM
jgi:ferritin-like metal-binding protein YciE